MKRAQFLERLKQSAQRLHYDVALSDIKFGSWLRKKLLATPRKRGRIRSWTAKEFRIALEICRLESQGIHATGAIKWHLWLKGFDPPEFSPTRARKHLNKEFKRWTQRLFEHVHTTHDPRGDADISPWRRRKIVASLGPQDERLKTILPLSEAASFDARNVIQFGVGGHALARIAETFFASLASWLPKLVGLENNKGFVSEIADIDPQLVGTSIVAAFAGVFGDPAEIVGSGMSSIRSATDEQFEGARNLLLSSPSMLRCIGKNRPDYAAGTRAAIRSLSTPVWRIGLFAMYVHWVRRLLPDLIDKLRQPPEFPHQKAQLSR